MEGLVDVKQVDSRSHKFSFATESTGSSIIRLNILYFPGWRIYQDGKELKEGDSYYITSREYSAFQDTAESGLIDIKVPPGVHHYLAVFGETPLRKIGDSISVISLLLLIPVSKKLVRSRTTISRT